MKALKVLICLCELVSKEAALTYAEYSKALFGYVSQLMM